jgi:hypothetical protein
MRRRGVRRIEFYETGNVSAVELAAGEPIPEPTPEAPVSDGERRAAEKAAKRQAAKALADAQAEEDRLLFAATEGT